MIFYCLENVRVARAIVECLANGATQHELTRAIQRQSLGSMYCSQLETLSSQLQIDIKTRLRASRVASQAEIPLHALAHPESHGSVEHLLDQTTDSIIIPGQATTRQLRGPGKRRRTHDENNDDENARDAHEVQPDTLHPYTQETLFNLACLERRLTTVTGVLLELRNPHLAVFDSLLLRDWPAPRNLFDQFHLTRLRQLVQEQLNNAQLETLLRHAEFVVKNHTTLAQVGGDCRALPSRTGPIQPLTLDRVSFVKAKIISAQQAARQLVVQTITNLSNTSTKFVGMLEVACSGYFREPTNCLLSRCSASELEVVKLLSLAYKTFNVYLLV
jgi:hypothetical protein